MDWIKTFVRTFSVTPTPTLSVSLSVGKRSSQGCESVIQRSSQSQYLSLCHWMCHNPNIGLFREDQVTVHIRNLLLSVDSEAFRPELKAHLGFACIVCTPHCFLHSTSLRLMWGFVDPHITVALQTDLKGKRHRTRLTCSSPCSEQLRGPLIVSTFLTSKHSYVLYGVDFMTDKTLK